METFAVKGKLRTDKESTKFSLVSFGRTVIYNNNVLIALFIVILLYFFELFNSENIFHFQEDLRFWISIGLIIFYLF